MTFLEWGGKKVKYIRIPTYCLGTPQNSSRFLKRYIHFKRHPSFLRTSILHLHLLHLHMKKIHHCVYKCQIAMQIGICVPNYPFCVFAKRMCRHILQVWVGSLLESWLPLSQRQIRCCLLTGWLRGESPSQGQPFIVVPGVDSKQKVRAERKTKTNESKKKFRPTIENWAYPGNTKFSLAWP